jgi:hypothetical protein
MRIPSPKEWLVGAEMMQSLSTASVRVSLGMVHRMSVKTLRFLTKINQKEIDDGQKNIQHQGFAGRHRPNY